MLKSIELTGEQKKVLFLPPQNPIQVKGVAGSGKTTVSLYRAKQLIETQNQLFSRANVAIFTYNKTLAAYIDEAKAHIRSIYNKDGEESVTNSGLDIQVTNFHKWAYSFARINNNQVVKPWDQERFIQNAIAQQKSKDPSNSILIKSVDFFKDEISWMKGKLFETEMEYLDAPRAGRGTTDRVTKSHKSTIWGVFKHYKRLMNENDKIDFDDFALLALKKIEMNPGFKPPFSHLVVDEAQDLNKAQILTLSKLVSEDTNSITIIADAAQRIYKSGFTWKEVGINVQGGRSIAFKKNYRNTLNIARAAYNLLEKEDDQSEFTESECSHLKKGEMPKFIQFSSQAEELNWLVGTLNRIDNPSSTVILHRTQKGVKECHAFLERYGVRTEIIKGQVHYFNNALKVCTMSSIKGLEFDNVIIIDLNDDLVPYPPGFIDENDEHHISTERRLLYTCMTRARKNLIMLSSSKPSRYLKDIDSNLIEKLNFSIQI